MYPLPDFLGLAAAWRLAAAALFASIASAGALAAGTDASPFGAPASSAEEKVAPAATLNAAGEGRRLYLKLNCYSCHGMRGAGGMGPRIVGAEAGDIREAVLQGEDEGMRSYRNYVTSTDLSNLSAYLRSIGKTGEPKFTHWWESTPSR